MRVFVAGGTGHVGGGIVREIVSKGHTATVLTRDARRVPPDAGVRAVAGDLGEPEPWARELADHDACIDAAGLLKSAGRNTFDRVVVAGTRNLVNACRAHGVARFVLITANGIDAARFPYQTTKLEAERIVKESGLAYTIFRPSIIYGPTDRFATLYAAFGRWGAIPFPGRGDYRVAPVALRDVAEAVVRSLGVAAAINRTLAVCGPEAVTFREFLTRVREASRHRRALLLPVPKWMMASSAAVLGWIPRFPANRAGIHMLVAGNVCEDSEWSRLLRVQPVGLDEGLRFLGRPMPPRTP